MVPTCKGTPEARALIVAPFSEPQFAELGNTVDVTYESWFETRRIHEPDELASRLNREGISILVVEADFVFQEVLEGAPSLRFVGVYRNTTSHVDIEAATEHGVLVVNTPGRNAQAVAEHALGLMLSLARRIPATHRYMVDGRWANPTEPYLSMRGVELAGRTLGIIGLGASGNVSMQLEHFDSRELFAITPSGRQYADLTEEDIAVVDSEVEPIEGDLPPSSETLMHLGIYRSQLDVGAVAHTHSVFASVAAVAGRSIPPIIDEMVVSIGGAIEVSEYAFPSSQELADNVRAALGERNAALIQNNGAVGAGRDLEEALDVCVLTERVAQVFLYASMLGKVPPLPKEVVEAETAIFRMRQLPPLP